MIIPIVWVALTGLSAGVLPGYLEMIEMVARPDGTITQKIPDSFAVYGGYSPSHWSVEMSAIGMYIPWHGNEALIRDLSKRMNQPGQPGAGNPTTGGPQVPFPNGDPNPEGYIYHPIPNGNTDGTIGGVNSNNSHNYPNSVSPPRSELNGPGSMKSWENLYGGVADIVVVAGNPSGVKQFNNWGDSCPGGKSNSEGVNSTP